MRLDKLKPKHYFFLAVIAVLAFYLYQADMNTAREALASQHTVLEGEDCMFFDGWETCEVAIEYCDKTGKEQPITFGLCENQVDAAFNRAALINEFCFSDEDCNEELVCFENICRTEMAPRAASLQACEETSECPDDEICLAERCEDPANPASWSNATFDNTDLDAVNDDIRNAWSDLEIQKKYLWFALFFVISLMFLYLLVGRDIQ